ncbi:glycosyltransferase [Tenacibaculum soleae]|uniref:glycosyltransferase family 2 protein n=1 Tax=Tenacibaculum soleae TaxID=447689 RepID=UPI0026E2BE05|nr:glycosyltransferase [Tenacibaculum soleae]MDO6743592.1 glycosyltransferase [Tenacibaculum soleae]
MNHLVKNSIDYFFLIYGVIIFCIYFSFIFLASIAIRKAKRKANFLNVDYIKGSHDLPSISLIAPAYNEGKTIITNVKSLLSIQYPFYELIIVNDGSNDDSIKQLITVFNLEEIPLKENTTGISCAEITTAYKSTNPKYASLTVVDKYNGGRSDAINCGIIFAKSNLVLCTDADCIIEQDALLKMVRPYIEATDKEVIASGGIIGLANDSVIKNGILKEVRVPKKMLPRIQVVEYIRAFLLGRMAWGQVDGLMLVSGAFGLYSRYRLLEVGGLDKDSVGEDLELCIRLRTHMEDLKKPYEVVYIPEVLCWTEAPPDFKTYISQRDRWARGLWETMYKHRSLFFNKKYGNMGKIFFPYWIFFELGAPIVEFLGILYIIYNSVFNFINWPISILLLIVVYLLGCVFSTVSVFMYSLNYKHYSKPKMIFQLLIAAYVESFYSHPVMLYAQLKGFFKKVFKIETGWGAMARAGFNEEAIEE